MKFLVAFVFLVAGTNVQAQSPVAVRNLVTDQVVAAIEDVIEQIRDLGLDPVFIQKEAGAFALPVPVLFNAAAVCENVLSTGLSDIVINHIHYDFLGFRLTFEIELPRIHLSAGIAAAEAVVFDNQLSASVSGSVDVRNINVRGVARVGILGGISIRSVDIDFKLGAIDSDLQIVVQNYDLSNSVNKFLGETIPRTLAKFKGEIDELIEILLIDFVNDNL